MLDGRTALITGAGGNLGRAVAAAFAAAGAALVLVGRSEASLRPDYGAGDARTMLVGADLSDSGAVAVAVGQALARFPRIDIVCNIAGGFDMGPPVHQTSDELWQRMFDLNVRTMLNTARAEIRLPSSRSTITPATQYLMLLIHPKSIRFGQSSGGHCDRHTRNLLARTILKH